MSACNCIYLIFASYCGSNHPKNRLLEHQSETHFYHLQLVLCKMSSNYTVYYRHFPWRFRISVTRGSRSLIETILIVTYQHFSSLQTTYWI